METERTKFRVLMFPWLAYGHIYPFLELAKRLSRRNFDIYFCSSAVNLVSIRRSIEKDLSDDDDVSIELVELHMPSLPELPPQLHTTKNIPSSLLPILLQAFQMSSSCFADIMSSVKPDLLIYDLFQPWAPKLALARGVPCVYYAASGAAAYSFFYHLYTKGTSATFPYQAVYLLDSEVTNLRQIMPNIKDADKEFALGNFKMSTDFVLMKSCRAVEGKYLDHLSNSFKKQIVPSGPLVAHSNDYCDDEELSEIMQWLHEKDKFSTAYISFGSEYFLSKEQIEEVAKGLELCDANFLWVIRFPVEEKAISVDEALPAGFLDRVKGRGLVVPGWAPQTKVLAHPSIGGFVSHCGWSSILESMYFGVPIIAMPMKSEQPLNGRLAVELGVGVEIRKDGNGQYVGEEVAKAINKVIADKTLYEGLRTRAKQLSEEMKEKAEQEENDAAEHLWRICMKNKQQK